MGSSGSHWGADLLAGPATKAMIAMSVRIHTMIAALFLPLMLQVGPAAIDSVATAAPLSDRVKIGAYVHLDGRPYQDPVAPEDLRQFEDRVGRVQIVHYFFSWGRPFREAINSNVDGRDLMLSMKPDGDLVAQIVAGRQDRYIDAFAADARAYGRPVYLRFGHEMNGQWMSYSAGQQGGPSAEAFKTAWRHLVDRFRARGAANVRFVWSPNEADFPDRAGNRMEDYWPGDAYVDIAGFDGYNWTNQQPQRGDGADRTFEQVVEGPYQRISRITGKEIWLCEFGTVEPSKGAWIRSMFASTRFPRLTGLIYFSENDRRDVQRDWRLDSSDDAATAWREATAHRKAPTDQVVSLPVVSAPSPFSPEIVRGIQSLLRARGHEVNVDGVFGSATETAVREFQREKGMTVTGQVDQGTWTRLVYG